MNTSKLKINLSLRQAFATWLIDIFLLGLVLVVFYTFWLGNYPLFTPDEGRYSEVAREMIANHDYITPRVNGVAFLDKPIFYYWLQVIAIKWFGLKEWALRLFPALSGIFGCLIVYGCGRSLFNRVTGVLAALILASSPLYFGHAHYANLDLEVAVFISASLLLFITAMHTKKRLLLFASYFFAAIAFLTKGLIGLFFPMMIIGAWILLQWQFAIIKKMHIISGLFLFTIIVLPWYLLVGKANPEFFHFFFVTQQVTRFLSQAEFNNQTPVWFYAPVIGVGFFPWTIFLWQAVKQHIQQLREPTHLFLFIWPISIFIFFSIPHSKIVGYILPVLPPLSLIVANYISEAFETIKAQDLRFHLILYQITAIFLAATLILSLQQQWLDLSRDTQPYLYSIAFVLFISVIFTFALYTQKSLVSFFATCLSVSCAILLILLFAAPHLNQHSTKPLITYLKMKMQPEDEVVHYYKFYQDVPLYLERRITIVNDWQSPKIITVDNWARELWFGMPFQNTAEWLIDEDTFWQRFASDKHVYVFVNNNYFEQFKSHAKKYFVLAKHKDVILISNHANF